MRTKPNKEVEVSIIVPAYNDEAYIKRCIESILKQTFKEFELLLVIDGATDGTEEICREYAKLDERVKVFVKKNGGTADSRNFGIKQASGKYLTFLDTDDYVDKMFLEVLHTGIVGYDADISAIKFKEVDENNITYVSKKCDGYTVFCGTDGIKNIFHDDIYGNFVWNKMYKKEMFNGVSFVKVPKIEDMATMYFIFDNANKVAYNSSELYFYVQRKGSQLHKREYKVFVNKLRVVMDRYYYLLPKYPDVEENYEEYARAIVECFPFNIKNRELIKKIKSDFKELYPRVKNSLSKSEKIRAKIYRLI